VYLDIRCGLIMLTLRQKSGDNTTGIIAINRMFTRFGCSIWVEMVRIKYHTDVFDKTLSVSGPGGLALLCS
jgi:hypothetical protein